MPSAVVSRACFPSLAHRLVIGDWHCVDDQFIEFGYRDRDTSETWSPAWLVLAGTAIIGLLVFQKTSTKPDKDD
ncbi:hypothetical protein N9X96_00980 [bacterium]|nr:hypothetical protein [bacterium]